MVAATVKKDVLINLVGKDADILAAAGTDLPGHILQLPRGGDSAGRIGREIEENQLRLFGKHGRQVRPGKGKGIRLLQVEGNRRPT